MRTWTIDPVRGNAWCEHKSEMLPEEHRHFQKRLRGQWGLRNSHIEKKERQTLLAIVDKAIADVKEKLALAEARAEKEAALLADCLAFDDSDEGERHRRYELAAHRKFLRSIDSFMKVRKAGFEEIAEDAAGALPEYTREAEEPVRDWEAGWDSSREPEEPAPNWQSDLGSCGDAAEPIRYAEPSFPDPTLSDPAIATAVRDAAIDPTVTVATLTTIETTVRDRLTGRARGGRADPRRKLEERP